MWQLHTHFTVNKEVFKTGKYLVIPSHISLKMNSIQSLEGIKPLWCIYQHVQNWLSRASSNFYFTLHTRVTYSAAIHLFGFSSLKRAICKSMCCYRELLSSYHAQWGYCYLWCSLWDSAIKQIWPLSWKVWTPLL